MKLNEMNIVITGANGAVATILIDYFSGRAAYVAGTVRKLAKNVDNYSTITIHIPVQVKFLIQN